MYSKQIKNDHPFFDRVPRMSGLQERVARNGTCPKCHAQSLKMVHASGGMEFMACDRCAGMYVLSANTRIKPTREAGSA